MCTEPLLQVGYVPLRDWWLVKISLHSHHVHPHLERMRESGQESRLLPQLERIHRQFCQFEQKNDYEPEKTVKIIREAKKVKGTTLG